MLVMFAVSSLFLAALLAAAAPAGAASKCQRLKGEDLARAASIKLILRERGSGEGDLVGCKLPSGRVWVLAVNNTSDILTVDAVAGSFVQFSKSIDEGTEFSDYTSIGDAATGRVYPVGTAGRPVLVRLSSRGRALAVEDDGPARAIVSYNARGHATILDRGSRAALPQGEVRLKGDVARWRYAGQAATARLSERKCQLSGTDLAAAPNVVLVRRDFVNDDGEDAYEYVGCVKPAGQRRVVAGGYALGLGWQDASVLAVAGSWVLSRFGFSNQYGANGATEVADLRSGRGYRVFSYDCPIGSCAGLPSLTVALVNDSGQAVTAAELQGRTSVVAFTAIGERRPVDEGASTELPTGSVRLEGSTVRWTRNGLPRSFAITE